MRPTMLKYPRTRHLEGSRLQAGDHDLEQVRFREIRGRTLVVEEKMDGANAGLSFTAAGELLLQSRGHYLDGGARERHFDLFKQWGQAHARALFEVLGARYVMYGEWLFAKHTCFYDALPHYFMEFDVYDREADRFLDTPSRAALLDGLPVVPVRVLDHGPATTLKDLLQHLGPSHFKTEGWREALDAAAVEAGVEPYEARTQTDRHDEMEGLYLKIEEAGRVVERLKYVRASFHNAILDSGSHWSKRPVIPNRLAPGVDLWRA